MAYQRVTVSGVEARLEVFWLRSRSNGSPKSSMSWVSSSFCRPSSRPTSWPRWRPRCAPSRGGIRAPRGHAVLAQGVHHWPHPDRAPGTAALVDLHLAGAPGVRVPARRAQARAQGRSRRARRGRVPLPAARRLRSVSLRRLRLRRTRVVHGDHRRGQRHLGAVLDICSSSGSTPPAGCRTFTSPRRPAR